MGVSSAIVKTPFCNEIYISKSCPRKNSSHKGTLRAVPRTYFTGLLPNHISTSSLIKTALLARRFNKYPGVKLLIIVFIWTHHILENRLKDDFLQENR